MTARPRHLRLISAHSEAPARATSGALFGADGCAPALSVAHAGFAAPLSDARSALLLDAARTVLPPRPPVLARVSADAGGPRVGSSWGAPERTRTCRPLVLSGAQLAFLEDLALLRRARSFRCDEGPSSDTLERAPEVGRVYVRRLLHPRAARGGANAITHGAVRGRAHAASIAERFLVACRAFVARCSRWLTLTGRPGGSIRDGSVGP